MSTLKVGIASYDEMKALTLAVARGQRKLAPSEPRVWFPSTESFAKVLSAGNRTCSASLSKTRPAHSRNWRNSPGGKSPISPAPSRP